MLYTIAAIFMILWILGIITGYLLNGYLHIFLVLGIILVLMRLISGSNDDHWC